MIKITWPIAGLQLHNSARDVMGLSFVLTPIRKELLGQGGVSPSLWNLLSFLLPSPFHNSVPQVGSTPAGLPVLVSAVSDRVSTVFLG